MSFQQHHAEEQAVELLQRSLRRGRLGHAYLFVGPDQTRLEWGAASLAKTLHCEQPVRAQSDGPAVDACDTCSSCRKVDDWNHPDTAWVRPESKSRVITIDQMREVIRTASLKPTQSRWKVAVITAADRLKDEAANAFLKTLEEPPGASVFILVSTDPHRMLETLISRCLRLSFGGENGMGRQLKPAAWLEEFSRQAARGARGILDRYRLLSVLIGELNLLRNQIEAALSQKSPLERYDEVDGKVREKWEVELAAAVESEYRHQRRLLLASLQWWFRDVWISPLRPGEDMLAFPELGSDTRSVGDRLTGAEAASNLNCLERTQRLLATNVQEALALEVGLLQLRLG